MFFSWEVSNSGRLAEASKASSQGQYVARVCHICLDCLPHSGGRQVFDPLAPGCHLLRELDGDQCRALAVGVAPSQGQAETAPTSPGEDADLELKSESARRSSSPFYSRRRSGRPPGGRERRAAQLLTPPPAHSLRPYRIAYLVQKHAPRRGRAKPGAL